ncbi:MAG: hypothetical protein EBX52_08590 [Proteobacteria bacterium]|nr:hypothetical protein [Pseudomonadota bacterium]
MSELNLDPKLESIKTNASEFVREERKTLGEFSTRILKDVEVLIHDSVNSATSRLTSMFNRVESVIKTEPLVAFTALAITGLAVANLITKRATGRSASSKSSGVEEPHIH